jgi:predicted exporter
MKKELNLPQNKLFAAVWLIFHLGILVPFLVMLASGHPINMDADLFNMLPKPEIGKAMGVADERLTEQTGQHVFILVSHVDFSTAKSTAENVYNQLKDSPRFKSVTLYSGASSLGQVTDFVHTYRWNLLDSTAVQQLSTSAGAKAFADNSLAKAYSAFTFSSLGNLEEDPFMLGEYNLQGYLKTIQESGTAMSPKDGVLASQYEGKWYVMISSILSEQGSALASKTNAVAQIYDVCNPLETNGIRFVYSGTPVHSYKSSTSASKEITIISTVTFLALVILLIIVFESPIPIICSCASILLSIGTAFAITHLIFGKIHILTLVFGTSLIGSCIDYSLHFFINWKANTTLPSGAEIRKHLMTGLLLSLISTELCYFILVFAPFNLLKQMAVFSLTGILSTFFTVICIYPLLKMPEKNRSIKVLKYYHMLSLNKKRTTGRIITGAFFAVTLITLGIFHKNVKIENNVSELYKMQGRVKDDAILSYKVLKYNPSGWFIVSGSTAEETLEREEQLCARLRKVNEGKELGGYVATSEFIPSIAAQKRSREAAKALLPYAEAQYEALGYSSSSAQKLRTDFDAHADDFVTPESTIPDYLKSAVSTEWLGNIDGKYYSIVLPVSITDENAYNKIADADPNVYFENKVRDIGRDLDRLTKTILILFAIAYVVIVIVLKFFYKWHETLKISSIPLLIVLVICSLFAACGIHLEFFSITGMILVFGLGLDYVIYMIENDRHRELSENSKLEPFAILLSFLTTAVSFGALALSSFVPVHMLGLSIFLGLTTAFVCTLF